LPRTRQAGHTLTDYLLGPVMSARATKGLSGLSIIVKRSPSAVDKWSVDVPPPLASDGLSHLWLGSLSAWLFPDVVIRPDPVEIRASPSEVWDVLLDFASYGEWNGFHRSMEIVDKPKGLVGLRMTVDLGPVMGTVVETSTIYYVDERRYIFVYGLRGDEGPSSMRVVWLQSTVSGTTIFNSYDMIGGWPALFCRGHIVRMVREGFNEQHLAIRDRVYSLQLKRAEADDSPSLSLVYRPQPESLGVCLVTGGGGFLGEHLVRMLALLPGVAHVHVLDLQTLRAVPTGVTFHQGSITDSGFVSSLFASVRPDVVFHLASLIDLRPGSAAEQANKRVNLDATIEMLALSKRFCVRRFIYTSSIEVGYHANFCENVNEITHPYTSHPTNHYQRSKIDADRAVLLANSPELATVVCRPAHIIGHSHWDKLANYLKTQPPVCFGSSVKFWGGASRGSLMSMVWVENCALGHILAAVHATRKDVCGRSFYFSDFNENIVSVYRALSGQSPPWICLPYWFLSVLVHTAILLHWILSTLSAGRIVLLGPMMGLHDGALAAGSEVTVSAERARQVLGYRDWVTREKAVELCRGHSGLPLIDPAKVVEVCLTVKHTPSGDFPITAFQRKKKKKL